MSTGDMIFTIVMGTLFVLGCAALAVVARVLMVAERKRRAEEPAARCDSAPHTPPPA